MRRCAFGSGGVFWKGAETLKKRFTVIFYAVWLAILVIIQPTAVQWISVFGISPDLFIVFVICAALLRGKTHGAVCGFIFGMALDLMTGRMIGLSAVLYMYAGFAAGVLKESFISSESRLGSAAFVLGAAFACSAVYMAAYSAAYGSPGLLYGICGTVLPKALYSAAAAFVFSPLIRRSFGLIAERSMFGRRPMHER